LGGDLGMERLTTEVLERLYRPVGEIIVQWGMIDICLHNLAFAMFKHIGTTPKVQGWPVQFGHRRERLEEMFTRREEFSDLARDAKQILKDIKHHQTLRDMLSHGAAVRYDPEKDAVLFQRIDRSTKKQLRHRPEETHRHSQMLVRFAELRVASENCTILNTGILSLRSAVVDLKQST
jgi:hypothetical protein